MAFLVRDSTRSPCSLPLPEENTGSGLASLDHDLLRETLDCIQSLDFGESEEQLLHSRFLVCRDPLADRRRTANQRSTAIASFQCVRNFRLSLLICILHDADRPSCTMNTLIVASNSLAMFLEHRELVRNCSEVAKHVTGITILRHELERDLLTTASNQQRNMGLLYPFGLINRTMHLIIRSFKRGLLLRPHREKDLDRFAQSLLTHRN